MSWKKPISEDEMGQLLWQLCRGFVEDFCSKLKPKLQAKGFLSDPAEDEVFTFEAMQLHLWLISSALNQNEDQAIIGVFQNNFSRSFRDYGTTDLERTQFQTHAEETATKRFAVYNKAFSRDKELHAKGIPGTALADSALQCLLKNEKPDTGLLILMEVQSTLSATIMAVLKGRADFKIRHA